MRPIGRSRRLGGSHRPRIALLVSVLMGLVLLLAACEVEEGMPDEEGAPDDDAEDVAEDETDDEADDELAVEEPDTDTDAEGDPIRIGHLAPLTGGLAHSGEDSVNGFELYWEQVGYEAGGRPVEIYTADTGCDPDNAITQARRLVDQEDVHFIVGPLCGHEGPAVEQVSEETGVPVLMSIAAEDAITQPGEVDTVIRTGFSASQVSHPFGAYAYDELGCRQVSAIGQDYDFGHDNTLGAMETFQDEGGEVLNIEWVPLDTADYGPVLGGIPSETDCVIVTVVGTDRLRLLEQWYDFGYDEQFEIYGNYWMLADILPEMDDNAVGHISHALHWAEGLDTPEARDFVDAFAEAYEYLPAYFAENAYTTAMWAEEALNQIDGDVEDNEAFLDAVRDTELDAPRGPVSLDEDDNPIQNVYITEIQVVDHDILGEIKVNVPIETYEDVSQYWHWDRDEYLERGHYER